MKRTLNLIRALLLTLLFGLMLFAAWLINTEAGLHWAVAQVRPYLPGELRLENLGGRLSGPLTVDLFSYRQDNGLEVEMGRLRLDWSPSALLVGQLRFSEVSAQQLLVELPPAREEGGNATTTLPDIALPVSVALGKLELNQIQIRRPEQATIEIDRLGLAASLHWDALKITRLDLSAYNARLDVTGKAGLSGGYAHSLTFAWQMDETPLGAARGAGTLRGDLAQTTLTHSLNHPIPVNAELTLSGLLAQPRWEGRIKAETFALQTLKPDLPQATLALDARIQGDPDQQTLTGTFSSSSDLLRDLDGEFRLTASPALVCVEEVHLHSPDRGRRASLHGQWQPDNKLAEFALSWHGIDWPLQGQAQVSSAHGSAYFKGKPEDYRFSLAADLGGPYWNDSHLRAIGAGTLEGLHISLARLLTLGGEVSGPVKLDWAQAFGWQTTLSAQGLNPGQRWPDWPGKVDFRLTSRGDARGALSASLEIDKLDGTLRQLPVQLKGGLDWRNETLSLHKLEFRSADSVATADGDIGAQLQLAWQLRSQQLSQLYPDLEGSLKASGSLSGERAAPLLQLQLEGQKLAWQNYAIGNIELQGQADLLQWQQLVMDARAEQLELAGQSLDAVQIKLNSEAQRQQLALEIKHPAVSLQLQADGSFNGRTWAGELNRTRIDSRGFGDWRQQRAAEVRLSTEGVSLERFCLDGRDAHVCIGADYTQHSWNAKVESEDFPLRLLSPLLRERMELNGTADISLQAALDPQRRLTGQGHVRLHPGSVDVRMPDNETDSWDYQQGSINITLDQEALKANAQLKVSEQDSLSFNAQLPQFKPFAFDLETQTLQASASLDLAQLDLLQGMIYEARNIKGRLTLAANATGTLKAPKVSGRLSLQDGALDIPRLGLKIRNLKLNAEGDDREVGYRLDADSGGGHLQAKGETQLQPAAGWPTQIDISGNDLEVSNIPEARIDVTPDLRITIKHHRIDANGTVRIPHARLQPKDISSAKLPSDDVRIEGAPPPDAERWQIYSNIRLILSERVFLNGFGFEGRITGNVLLKNEPGRPPIGVGELSVVEGRYSAYGQRLQIERGRLLFASSPLNNPGLDLRAVRRVQDVTAGVSVTGTLRNPKFDLFSTPAMGQTDTLAYLLLGRPLEKGAASDGSVVAGSALALGLKGEDFLARKIGDRFGLDEVRVEASQTGKEASLLMGRYLSPKLYISYGVGLIQAVNTLKLRYEITDRWQLTAESGEEQGADLLYTFERGD